MSGTVLLLSILICGYFKVSFWVVLPASIVAAFIGINYPNSKSETLKARGMYWSTFLGAIPLQLVFVSLLFGIGWGLSTLLN